VDDEDRDWCLSVFAGLAIHLDQPQRKDEVVETVLLPGIEGVLVGQAGTERREFGQPSQWSEEHSVGARKGGGNSGIGGDRLVQFDRTSRGSIPSAAAWSDGDDRLKRAHHGALFPFVGRSGGRRRAPAGWMTRTVSSWLSSRTG
jgi:hypothetical protein